MEHDIYELPEVNITGEEERSFTAAETLIDYLMVYGAKLSHSALIRHLEHLGVTEPQLPALLDYAGRRRILADPGEADLPDTPRIRAIGLLIMDRIEEHCIFLRDREKQTLRLLYGLEGGEPRTLTETAEIIGTTPERVRQIEVRICRLLTRAAIRQKRYKRIRDFYA